ncbi:MAG: zinc-ribbon domain-containing protein [Rhodobacteraceae bacterium]|nr:zinc-ribbon domain-containing protein [Paracoccaceae bacterium]
MRITCPRCTAHYEVPDSVMPSGGRDVQCSDCGYSWYQLVSKPTAESHDRSDPPRSGRAPAEGRPDSPPHAQAAEASAPGPGPQETESETRLRRLREALDGHKARSGARSGARTLNLTQSAAENDAPDADDPGDRPAERSDPQDAPFFKRELDPAVAAVLRAEAEFERNARAHGPAQALEMQPELGLEPPPRGKRSADTVRDRLARLQAAERTTDAPIPGGEETYPEPAGLAQSLQSDTAPPRPRPDPPPPAEVIFSKAGLPVRAAGRDLAAIEVARARNEFRWGFILALSICLLLPAIYVSAPALADLMPGQTALFETIAQTGAQVHLALASAMQDLLFRIGTWMNEVAANAPTA